ncbi:MAG: metal-dependent transcriptional regulator [Spirochaetaceae bacterium]|nr:MAG: metal-dependent transcriptional regulator [Spirochaetaceae bacterium]
MLDKMELTSSLEDYIEAIYEIIEENEAVRAKDISQRLGVKNSSVTGALRILSEKALVNYEPYGIITLTTTGREIARNVTEKHKTLSSFFMQVLGVDEKTAGETACKMEHAMSDDLRKRLHRYLLLLETCPRLKVSWEKIRGGSCKQPLTEKDCMKCLEEDMNDAHA